MDIIDISKTARRFNDRRRRDVRRVAADENTVLARIARLQRALDSRMRNGDKEGFIAGRRELHNLIFTVVSEDLCIKERN